MCDTHGSRAKSRSSVAIAFGWSGEGAQLLSLVDDHQHQGARVVVIIAKLVGEVEIWHVPVGPERVAAGLQARLRSG